MRPSGADIVVKTGAEVAYAAIGLRALRKGDLSEASFQVVGPDIPAVPPQPTTLVAAEEEAAEQQVEDEPGEA